MAMFDRRPVAGDSIIAAIARRAAELVPDGEQDLNDDELFNLIDAAAHLRPETIEDVGFLLLAAHHRVNTLEDNEGRCDRRGIEEIEAIISNVVEYLIRAGHVQLAPTLAAYFFESAPPQPG